MLRRSNVQERPRPGNSLTYPTLFPPDFLSSTSASVHVWLSSRDSQATTSAARYCPRPVKKTVLIVKLVHVKDPKKKKEHKVAIYINMALNKAWACIDCEVLK